MGKSMYNFGKREKEKARQQKQMEKTAKRLLARQNKAHLKTDAPQMDPSLAESEVIEKI